MAAHRHQHHETRLFQPSLSQGKPPLGLSPARLVVCELERQCTFSATTVLLFLQGSEPLALVSGRADCSNGYVKGSKAMTDTQPKASEMVGELGSYPVKSLSTNHLLSTSLSFLFPPPSLPLSLPSRWGTPRRTSFIPQCYRE